VALPQVLASYTIATLSVPNAASMETCPAALRLGLRLRCRSGGDPGAVLGNGGPPRPGNSAAPPPKVQ